MEPEAAANVWAPAIYDISKSPTLEATLNIESDPKFLNNFPRNAKWSVRLYNPPQHILYLFQVSRWLCYSFSMRE